MREGAVELGTAEGGREGVAFLEWGPVRRRQEPGGGREAEGIWYPAGDGCVVVVFDEEEDAARSKGGVECLQECRFVADKVQGIGHEDAVEVLQVEMASDEVGFARMDVDAVACSLTFDVGMEVDGFDGAAFRQEIRECEAEGAGATAEVGPALGGGSGVLGGARCI